MDIKHRFSHHHHCATLLIVDKIQSWDFFLSFENELAKIINSNDDAVPTQIHVIEFKVKVKKNWPLGVRKVFQPQKNGFNNFCFSKKITFESCRGKKAARLSRCSQSVTLSLHFLSLSSPKLPMSSRRSLGILLFMLKPCLQTDGESGKSREKS